MEWCERAVLSRLRTMCPEEAERLPDSGEGVAARLISAGRAARSLEELYALAKTKRYAHARIRRLALWAYLGLAAEDRPERAPYLRVLGFNERGRAVLREMEGRAQAPILTKPAHARDLGSSPAAFACGHAPEKSRGISTPQKERDSISPSAMRSVNVTSKLAM